jgi:1,4-dihydroxy-2-naphthoate octaprenyltransferase
MFKKSNWLHLRIGFSVFLLPVFLFSLAFVEDLDIGRTALVFIILHLFLYPSSNAYNSYYDKDEGSIGGLKHPPKVDKGLLYLSLVFLAVSLVLGWIIHLAFGSMLLVYSLVSMAYSHPSIRIKKYPYGSWLIAGFFQGCFTFVMAYSGLTLSGWENFAQAPLLVPGLLTTLLLWSAYPLTQVYQHQEDGKRGDRTLSLSLGVQGTFVFSSIWFLISGGAFTWYFVEMRDQVWALWGFLAAMSPVLLYFTIWFFFIRRDEERHASYGWTMWMNRISAIALNGFFLWYLIGNFSV